MAISARNQLAGVVSSTEHGAVNDEVELTRREVRSWLLLSPLVAKMHLG